MTSVDRVRFSAEPAQAVEPCRPPTTAKAPGQAALGALRARAAGNPLEGEGGVVDGEVGVGRGARGAEAKARVKARRVVEGEVGDLVVVEAADVSARVEQVAARAQALRRQQVGQEGDGGDVAADLDPRWPARLVATPVTRSRTDTAPPGVKLSTESNSTPGAMAAQRGVPWPRWKPHYRPPRRLPDRAAGGGGDG